MTTQELRKQIDSFFEGNLSEADEQALRDYLATHEVPQEFLAEKRIVLALVPHTVEIPEGLEERLSSFIDRLPARKKSDAHRSRLAMGKRYCRYRGSGLGCRTLFHPTTSLAPT